MGAVRRGDRRPLIPVGVVGAVLVGAVLVGEPMTSGQFRRVGRKLQERPAVAAWDVGVGSTWSDGRDDPVHTSVFFVVMA